MKNTILVTPDLHGDNDGCTSTGIDVVKLLCILDIPIKSQPLKCRLHS